jgi:hypothetical protein
LLGNDRLHLLLNGAHHFAVLLTLTCSGRPGRAARARYCRGTAWVVPLAAFASACFCWEIGSGL